MQKEQKQSLTAESAPPVQGKFRRLFSAFKVCAAYFFKESFRRHTKEEYDEFFSRGHTEKDKVNRAYPWVYMRALCVLFLFFAFVVLVFMCTENTIAYPTVLLFGGIFINVPLIICLYELYPKRDLKFSTLVIVMIIGGVVSVSLSEIGYTIYSVDDSSWFSPFYTGILEELCKALAAIIAIVSIKNRNPYVCFLIAAAVGTGFSISEDMGYVFVYARSSTAYLGINLEYGVAVGMARAVISLCTHIMWTGLIGWAYAKFKKPFINPKFWAVAIFSVLLHSVWDFSLNAVAMTFIRIGLAVLVAVPVISIIVKSRKPDIPKPLRLSGEQLSFTPEPESLKISHKANLNFAIYMVAAAIFFLAAVCFPYGYEYVTVSFSTVDEFVCYMQNGLTFESDWNREYDETCDDYSYVVEDGFKTQAMQKVESGGYTYYYLYYFSEEEEQTEEQTDGDMGEITEETEGGTTVEGGEEQEPEEKKNLPVAISLELDGETYYCMRIRLNVGAVASEDETYEYASYYWLNTEVISWSRNTQTITVTTSAQEAYGYAGEIILLVATTLCALAAVATFTYYKFKARDAKKAESAKAGAVPEKSENKTETVENGGTDKKE